MSKGLIFVVVGALIGAVYFYNVNSLYSMICILIVLACAFTTGRL